MLNSQLQQIKNRKNNYKKLHLSFKKQLEHLKSKGLVVPNEAYALKKLSHLNYYRLSAYSLNFKYPKLSEKADVFYEGTEFREIIQLYDFDAKLRRLIFGALETIEVYVRTQIAYIHTAKYEAFGYLEYENFQCSSNDFEKLIKDIKSESKRSDEKFIKHFKEKYNSTDLPLWSIVEVLSFGTLSRLFSLLKVDDKKEVVKGIGIHQKIFQNWLHTLTIVRNMCAHHSRTWNKQLRIQFAIPSKNQLFEPIRKITKKRFHDGKMQDRVYDNKSSIFFALSVIKYILDSIGEDVDFVEELKELLNSHPNIDKNSMDFVYNWSELNIWSDV